MLNTKQLFPLSLLTLALTGCGGSSGGGNDNFQFDATAVIENETNNIIVAGYQNLATSADTLVIALSTLQTNQDETTLTAAQNAWKAAREPWEQGESHIFGPVDALEIDPHLDSWPLNTADLASTISSYSGEDITALNDDVQGFHAIEYLLFGNGVNSNDREPDLSVNERAYLAALSTVFARYTESLYDNWETSFESSNAYKTYLLNPGSAGNQYYPSDLAVMDELINGMIGIVDEVANGKIADPFGTSINDTDTTQVESQYSWNSLTDFTNNIIGVRNVYQGEFDGQTDAAGIIDFVAAADENLAERVADEIDAAIAAIQNIGDDGSAEGMPFRTAIDDAQGRVRIQAAIDSLHTLYDSLQNDVLPLLNRWENTAG